LKYPVTVTKKGDNFQIFFFTVLKKFG